MNQENCCLGVTQSPVGRLLLSGASVWVPTAGLHQMSVSLQSVIRPRTINTFCLEAMCDDVRLFSFYLIRACSSFFIITRIPFSFIISLMISCSVCQQIPPSPLSVHGTGARDFRHLRQGVRLWLDGCFFIIINLLTNKIYDKHGVFLSVLSPAGMRRHRVKCV